MHHRSSTNALISVIHDWLRALDNGCEICVVFFDVQKAFDSVPHIPLLQKLANININPYILKWVQDYLTDRRQYVAVEGSSSPTLNVLSGVPQGSVLGPLLFIIYLNDVVHHISNCSKMNLFADDIALHLQLKKYLTILYPFSIIYISWLHARTSTLLVHVSTAFNKPPTILEQPRALSINMHNYSYHIIYVIIIYVLPHCCLLYTSDAADE